jgi:large conductance mechanosensitive channel
LSVLSEFKRFLTRGNLVELAAAFVVVLFFVVEPYNMLMARRATEDPDTKECPECTSVIPVKARRCPECTSELVVASA